MILSESELSNRAAQESLPFRDAFAVLFFVSVGMLFNPAVLVEQPAGDLRDLRRGLARAEDYFGKSLAQRPVGVHVGEWGCYNRTPHATALAWMRDHLAVWRDAGWGWALWNFRGPFGLLDSRRGDVAYEDFHGHQLDRKLLELLRSH